jgi:hypothetical protein
MPFFSSYLNGIAIYRVWVRGASRAAYRDKSLHYENI